jgi:hypothetical protein
MKTELQRGEIKHDILSVLKYNITPSGFFVLMLNILLQSWQPFGVKQKKDSICHLTDGILLLPGLTFLFPDFLFLILLFRLRLIADLCAKRI